MSRFIDLAGKRFGRWKVIATHSERRRYGNAGKATFVLWHCRCDCGVEGIVFGTNLRRGLSKSCGCAAREALRRRNTKHGHAVRGQHTRVYDAWQHAKQRCLNPNNKDYPNYGGRGIGFHPDYCDDFLAFFADLLDPPPGLSIDRIDNNGNYEPGNCQWATASMQRANQRRRKRKGRRSNVADMLAFSAALARASARCAPPTIVSTRFEQDSKVLAQRNSENAS
jgi:hypothetical protein